MKEKYHSSSSFMRANEPNKLTYSQLCGFIAHLEKHCTDIAEVVGSNPDEAAFPGARFSKVPKTFRARKAICETGNRLFWKVDLLTCFQGNKNQNDCEV